ncbi:sugar ABC transporter permease [Paenibacillus sp. MSJ-34]|uniref:ABC transporter permease n=1 Tax=Paenibacillus sp. MSJ-34 TaxID=2841529 RepID=UPI001C1139E3|nr:ABC transporter permease subunit [Paenibacillus sp. MSJ-34]MBU5441230.1 ABC transporter permease subunit [Paenibacillus sp. MSJ-34]
MKGSKGRGYFRNNLDFWLMSLPGLLYLIVYKFIPIYGLTLAFKDFNMFIGNGVVDSIFKSPWVGLKHFERIFGNPEFLQIIGNTLIISIYKIVFLFPLPIILALLLNEVSREWFKRTIQTLVYLPHFLSWVVIFGLFYTLLGSYGVVNQLLETFGIGPIKFFTDPSYFRALLVSTDGWKEAGWSAIVFLAAMTGIDPQLYEAAKVDGANRLQRMLHITIPGILPVIVLMLILRVGAILNAGFEQILAMYNPSVYKVADIIQTYVYRVSLGQMDFSLGTALGLFESLVAFVLVLSCNALCRKTLGRSLW